MSSGSLQTVFFLKGKLLTCEDNRNYWDERKMLSYLGKKNSQFPVSLHCCLVTKSIWLFATPGTTDTQAPPHRIAQARILEWVAISFSRGSSWPRDWICIPELQADSLPLSRWWSPYSFFMEVHKFQVNERAAHKNKSQKEKEEKAGRRSTFT